MKLLLEIQNKIISIKEMNKVITTNMEIFNLIKSQIFILQNDHAIQN